MRIVTVARKPCASSSTTANVVEHSCGAINIDATRIRASSQDRQDYGLHNRPSGGLTGPVYGSWESKRDDYKRPDAGRWPANLVLQHFSSCRQTGTVSVPGYVINRWKDGAKPFGGGAGHEYESEAQSDETVAVWQCEVGCPVRFLGEQSGITTSGAMKHSVGGYDGESITGFLRGNSGPQNQPGGTGTAARFFKQVQGTMTTEVSQELWDYLYMMIAPPPACEPVILSEADLSKIDFSKFPDQSVHGMITVGDPSLYLEEIDRVLKPGAHLLLISDETDMTGATGACAAEDFGYEVRDAIAILDTPGEFHYVAKAAKKERNAGVPEFEKETTSTVYFPVEGTDTDELFKQLCEASEEEVPKDWLTNGVDEDQIPEHLQELFEERDFTKITKSRNSHPTVKPIAVMEALMKDIPPGSLIIDPFLGSGSTGIASLNLGMDFIGIEQDADYLRIAHHRIHHADAATASWNAADIQSEVVEEAPKPTSLNDLFGL